LLEPILIVLQDGSIAADDAPERILDDENLCKRTGLSYQGARGEAFAVPGNSIAAGQRSNQRPSALILDRVTLGYEPDRPVVRDIEFSLSSGETIGLVGATGVGKSSVGLFVCGLLSAQEGGLRFSLADHDHANSDRKPGWVAGLFQQPERQFFLATCAEEVAFGPRNIGVTLDTSQISEALAMVGLPPDQFLDRDPFSLSSGEKRRLAFAAVLSMSPSFVVFDEPTCALDPTGVGQFIRLSRELKHRGTGQLLITHEGDIIKNLADRIACIDTEGNLLLYQPGEFFGDPDLAGVISTPSGWTIN
jgi:energy-coupling factor transport system ATP-binding protein